VMKSFFPAAWTERTETSLSSQSQWWGKRYI